MKISLLIKNIFVVFIFSSGASCSGNIDQNNNLSKDAFAKGSTHNSIPALKLDSTTIASFFIQHSLLSPLKKELQSFYNARQYGFVWFDKKGLIKQAGNLYNHLQDISSEGLPDKMLYKNEFKNLMKNDGMDSINNPSVITELMLTAQYFIYAKNVWSGLNQKDTKDLKWHLPHNKISYAQLLDSLISGSDLLDSAPVYRQYLLLKN